MTSGSASVRSENFFHEQAFLFLNETAVGEKAVFAFLHLNPYGLHQAARQFAVYDFSTKIGRPAAKNVGGILKIRGVNSAIPLFFKRKPLSFRFNQGSNDYYLPGVCKFLFTVKSFENTGSYLLI